MSNKKKIYILNNETGNLDNGINGINISKDHQAETSSEMTAVLLIPSDTFEREMDKGTFLEFINNLVDKITDDEEIEDLVYDHPILDDNYCDQCPHNNLKTPCINPESEYKSGTSVFGSTFGSPFIHGVTPIRSLSAEPIHGLMEYTGDRKWMKKLINKSIHKETNKIYSKLNKKMDNILTQIYGIDNSICDNHSEVNDQLECMNQLFNANLNKIFDIISGEKVDPSDKLVSDQNVKKIAVDEASSQSVDEINKRMELMSTKLYQQSDTINKLLDNVGLIIENKLAKDNNHKKIKET